jgi:formyl-CoA transferase
MSGLMSITGEAGRPPVKVGVPIADLSAALFGAYAIMAALYAREKTGRGQRIDISLLESALALEVWETSGYFATGQVPEPLGSAHRVSAPYQAVRTADGYITIGATTPGNWKATCALLGLEQLEHDKRFAVVSARRAHYQELAALIEAVTMTRPTADWHALFEKAGVPCGELNRLDEALADRHIQERGFVVELPHTRAGTLKATGSPMRLSDTLVRMSHAGPLLGEHTRDVLGELGIRDDELETLAKERVIGFAA